MRTRTDVSFSQRQKQKMEQTKEKGEGGERDTKQTEYILKMLLEELGEVNWGMPFFPRTSEWSSTAVVMLAVGHKQKV